MKNSWLLVVALIACGPMAGDEPGNMALDSHGAGKAKSVKQALSVCSGPNTVPGIDVSEWQGAINWQDVANAGFKYAITRINDGYHQDPYFGGNWDSIKQVGMIRGAYQFYEPNIDPTTQANWVINAVGVLGPGDLPVTLDVEWTSGTPNAADIGSWVAQVQAGTGKVPMIYTAVGYWNQYFNGEFSNLDLWVANYGVNCPSMPSSWGGWLFWQWGGGPVAGIAGNVDQNVFNGTEDELRTAAGQQAWSNCTAGLQVGCSHYGCNCADGTCSGGFCPGTGCTAQQSNNCGAFGVNCVDQNCAGGFGPGTGCTAKETADCGAFGCNCVDHQCNGGFCPGTGCTAKETIDCGNYGCGCVDHQCNGVFCPGTGCTAKETIDCTNNGGQGCANHVCTPAPVVDAGTPPEEDAGVVMMPPPDAGQPMVEPDAGQVMVEPDAGAAEIDAGMTLAGMAMNPQGEATGAGGVGAVMPPKTPAKSMMVHGGCSSTSGLSLLGLGLVLSVLARRRVAVRNR
ncbi:MAG: GH25 family lysozyme [Myxococcaceae bacterium]